jgi:hypothetical protein
MVPSAQSSTGKQNGLDNAGHDCCCIASVGMPPAFDGAPAELITTGRLSAQWLAPLSRGPPLLA